MCQIEYNHFGGFQGGFRNIIKKLVIYIYIFIPKIHANWSISHGDIIRKGVKMNIWPYSQKYGKQGLENVYGYPQHPNVPAYQIES